ncbi:MAG: MerR family transcriptional regulator [Solirubrobacteraceae bacterium]
MATELTIGAFSRITHLSVKTLRHYHDWGLLEPAAVDPDSGYRLYSPAQVPAAQAIRRFRDLAMPIEQVKAVLAAEDPALRSELIAAHLRRMEEQLARTQQAVASLRALVEGSRPVPAIEHVTLPALEVLAITETVPRDRLHAWWREAFFELRAALGRAGGIAAGPAGGVYAQELFEAEAGECTVYLPVVALVDGAGRARITRLPERTLAVAVHVGAHGDVDLVYAALGTHVAERGIDGGGPVHERYLAGELDGPDPAGARTEIGWPITTATAAP